MAYDSGRALHSFSCQWQLMSANNSNSWTEYYVFLSSRFVWPNLFWLSTIGTNISQRWYHNVITNFSNMDRVRGSWSSATNFCVFVLFSFCLMFLQNDLIHAWGLDFQLGYCSQAIFSSSKNMHLLSSNIWLKCEAFFNRVIGLKLLELLILSTFSITVFPHWGVWCRTRLDVLFLQT